MNILVWCAITGLIAGIVVYVIQEWRRRALLNQLDMLRTTAAAAATRVEDLQRYAGEQAQKLTNAHAEREALLIDSDDLQRRIRDLQQRLGAAAPRADRY